MEDFKTRHTPQQVKVEKPARRSLPLIGMTLFKSVISLLTFAIIAYCLVNLPPYFYRSVNRSDISITGNRIVEKETILSLLPLKDSIRWIDIDPFRWTESIVNDPWINGAIVHRTPELRVHIIIRETTPRFFLKTEDALFLVNHEFRVLHPVLSGTGWNKPVIVSNSLEGIQAGRMLPDTIQFKIDALVQLLDQHPVLPLEAVSEIDITDPLNVELVTIPDGVRIKLGDEGYREKLENLRDALPILEKEGSNLRYIDLRYKRAVVFRRKI